MSDGKNDKDASQIEQGSPPPIELTPQPADSVTPAPKKPGLIRWTVTGVDDVLNVVIPGKKELVERYGFGVFPGFLLGIFICILVLREWDWARSALMPAPPPITVEQEKRDKLTSINFTRADPPPFLRDHEKLFGYFAESHRPAETLENPPIGVVNYVFSRPVQAFTFKLRPRMQNSEINVRVFRELTTGNSNNLRTIYEPVPPQGGSPREGFIFKVQECNANDKLFMVLLIVPRQPGITNFTDYFDVRVE